MCTYLKILQINLVFFLHRRKKGYLLLTNLFYRKKNRSHMFKNASTSAIFVNKSLLLEFKIKKKNSSNSAFVNIIRKGRLLFLTYGYYRNCYVVSVSFDILKVPSQQCWM